MVRHDTLVWRQGGLIGLGTFSREGSSMATGLVYPFQDGRVRSTRTSTQHCLVFFCFIILFSCLICVIGWLLIIRGWLLNRLRIAEGITEDDLVTFQLSWHIDSTDSLSVSAPKRVLTESVRKGTQAGLSQSILILLQLLDERGLDFEVRPARIQKFKCLYHRPAILAHQIDSQD